MVLYLTDKTSASTTNPANNMLAISENAHLQRVRMEIAASLC